MQTFGCGGFRKYQLYIHLFCLLGEILVGCLFCDVQFQPALPGAELNGFFVQVAYISAASSDFQPLRYQYGKA
jgi:hypothetical protein